MANIQLAVNLRRLRTDHDYTQAQISDKLNISRQAYSNYETGKRIPDLDILIRIAAISITLHSSSSFFSLAPVPVLSTKIPALTILGWK